MANMFTTIKYYYISTDFSLHVCLPIVRPLSDTLQEAVSFPGLLPPLCTGRRSGYYRGRCLLTNAWFMEGMYTCMYVGKGIIWHCTEFVFFMDCPQILKIKLVKGFPSFENTHLWNLLTLDFLHHMVYTPTLSKMSSAKPLFLTSSVVTNAQYSIVFCSSPHFPSEVTTTHT